MSMDVMIWAVKDAPLKDVYEHAVLTVLSDEADEAGCGVFPSVPTIAERAHCDPREVRRCLVDMEARKILGRGDQALAAYIRADRRPIVYDVLMPASAYGTVALERVNRERLRKGRPPLTSENRPDIAPPPPKPRRSDVGKPKKKKVLVDARTASPGVDGRTSSPGGLADAHDRTTRSPRPDYQSANPLVLDPEEITPPPPGDHGRVGDPLGSEVEEISANLEDPRTIAAGILRDVTTRLPAEKLPGPADRRTLIGLTVAALVAGWPPDRLKARLGAQLDGAGSVFAVLRHRLTDLPDVAVLRPVSAPAAGVVCPKHRGQPADHCLPCAGERKAEQAPLRPVGRCRRHPSEPANTCGPCMGEALAAEKPQDVGPRMNATTARAEARRVAEGSRRPVRATVAA
jgi:hypothetical protein